MKKLTSFLDKFHTLTPPNDALRRAVAKAASLTLGTTVEKQQVVVRNGVAFIDVSSVAKNKLRIERGVLLEYLYDHMPKARQLVRDVR